MGTGSVIVHTQSASDSGRKPHPVLSTCSQGGDECPHGFRPAEHLPRVRDCSWNQLSLSWPRQSGYTTAGSPPSGWTSWPLSPRLPTLQDPLLVSMFAQVKVKEETHNTAAGREADMQDMPVTSWVLGAFCTPQPPWHVDATRLQTRACGVGSRDPSIGEGQAP